MPIVSKLLNSFVRPTKQMSNILPAKKATTPIKRAPQPTIGSNPPVKNHPTAGHSEDALQTSVVSEK